MHEFVACLFVLVNSMGKHNKNEYTISDRLLLHLFKNHDEGVKNKYSVLNGLFKPYLSYFKYIMNIL